MGKYAQNLGKCGCSTPGFEDLGLGQLSSQGSKDPRDYLLTFLEVSRSKICAKGHCQKTIPDKLGGLEIRQKRKQKAVPHLWDKPIHSQETE